MTAAEIPLNDSDRLAELYKYELLDTVYEQEFDQIVQLASIVCKVPISLITLVDLDRQWFKAKHGLDVAQTARSVSFCGHAILNDRIFEVKDALNDDRFYDNPLVTGDPNIRYYAGMPLLTQNGYRIGTLCVIDQVPREMDAEQSFALKVLGNQVIKLFELRLKNKELKKINDVRQTMMTIMAHDIRGPLAAFKAVYELKSEGLLSAEELIEVEAMVPVQFENTIHLLNSIVEWGRLQLSDEEVNYTTFHLFQLVEETFTYITLQAHAKNNQLENKVDPQLEIAAKREGVYFVLRNILGNANKFTKNGTITVSAEISNNILHISIRDTGVGMSEKARLSINERRWSAIELGTSQEKGSGMGLKMIFEYIESIGGSIEFFSEPQQGTRVLITLLQE